MFEEAATLGEVRLISLGDYVLNGGEVAAMVIIDAVMRLIPGVLGDEASSVEDSFSSGRRWLEGEGAWARLQSKVVPFPSVRGVLAAVEAGRVEAGIVY